MSSSMDAITGLSAGGLFDLTGQTVLVTRFFFLLLHTIKWSFDRIQTTV